MKRPIESDYISQAAYTRALEAYCDRQDRIRRAEEAFEASQFNPDWSMLEAAHESLREHMSRIKELEAKLAQQEQIIQSYLEKDNSQQEQGEPAKLWCETCEGTGEVYQEHQAGCHVGGHFKCPDCDGEGYIVSGLYSTAPQQRTWVELTSQETDIEAAKEEQAHGFILGALWAEAKLKEKNT
jgi:Zn finger protein HypA/HybF involved in hydrogenase expression